MSQQTRLEVVVPRFLEWMERVPTAAHLAALSEDEVLAMWAGLGYYNRARNLHRLAKEVALAGWPSSFEGLKALPGVGDYTAAAVASLAFGESVAAIDGNVERVLSRVFALDGDLRQGEGKRHLRRAAEVWIEGHPAGLVNEATMELGARVCLPRNPKCETCPLATGCRAFLTDSVARFPQARARPETVEVRESVLVLRGYRGTLLRRSGSDELLSGHWTLPRAMDVTDSVQEFCEPCGSVKHAITHHRIVWEVLAGEYEGDVEGLKWCPVEELPARIVSSLPRKALAKAGIGW